MQCYLSSLLCSYWAEWAEYAVTLTQRNSSAYMFNSQIGRKRMHSASLQGVRYALCTPNHSQEYSDKQGE